MNGLKTGETSTVIGRGATLHGDLISTEDVLIEGALEGTVNAAGARLTIGAEARVRADLNAQEVIILGRVEGTIRATERAELRAGSFVTGDVFAKRFAMEQDASLRGRVDPSRAAEPMTVTAEPVTVEASAPISMPVASEPAPSLFGGAAAMRPAGQMPAGLAAAARTFGSASTPAGLNALTGEPSDETHE